MPSRSPAAIDTTPSYLHNGWHLFLFGLVLKASVACPSFYTIFISDAIHATNTRYHSTLAHIHPIHPAPPSSPRLLTLFLYHFSVSISNESQDTPSIVLGITFLEPIPSLVFLSTSHLWNTLQHAILFVAVERSFTSQMDRSRRPKITGRS